MRSSTRLILGILRPDLHPISEEMFSALKQAKKISIESKELLLEEFRRNQAENKRQEERVLERYSQRAKASPKTESLEETKALPDSVDEFAAQQRKRKLYLGRAKNLLEKYLEGRPSQKILAMFDALFPAEMALALGEKNGKDELLNRLLDEKLLTKEQALEVISLVEEAEKG